MKLKKLIPELAESIIDLGFEKEIRDIQSTCIPAIKSGADILMIAPEGSGKSTALAIGVIQQLKKAVAKAPRAIVMVETREKAFALEEQIKLFAKHTTLRTFTVFDLGNLLYQKDTIYEGVDILIGTPKRLNELMTTAGFPIAELKLFMVDDAEKFYFIQQNQVIYRIVESIPKSQIIISANIWIDKFELLSERLLKNPVLIEG